MGRYKGSWQPESMNTKKTPKQQRPSKHVEEEPEMHSDIPLALQQTLLNIFRNTCVKGPVPQIEELLQEVKGHLYDRNFAAAFGRDDYLDAYAARWSPSRALGYAQMFVDIEPHISELMEKKPEAIKKETPSEPSQPVQKETEEPTDEVDQVSTRLEKSVRFAEETPTGKPLDILCLGGGAGAEVVGLAGWLKRLQSSDSPKPDISTLNLHGIDIANWNPVMSELHHACVNPATLSKYASASAKAANVALLPPSTFDVKFTQQDLLDASPKDLVSTLASTDIVTILFTLNELYTASVPKTQRLLYSLTSFMRPGTLLLVVDSPGSYSAVTINGAEKKYPMQWLLDHTLLKKEEGEKAKWDKVVGDESRWWRLPKEDQLKYPIELENMRYQIHLYTRNEDGKED